MRKGTPAPKADFVLLNVADEFGNARGGIRSPWLDVPGGTFHPEAAGLATCTGIGYWVPFSWQRLEAIHGSYGNYAKKFLASVDRLVKDRWVLASDGEKIKAQLRAKNPLE